jgi:PAS domain S-box-containing protein
VTKKNRSESRTGDQKSPDRTKVPDPPLDEESAAYTDLGLLQMIVDSTQEILFAIDRQYRLLYGNKAYQQAIAAAGGQTTAIGQTIVASHYSDETRSFWTTAYERCFAGESFALPYSMMTADGQYYSENRFNPLRDQQGNIVGAIVIARDVTANRTAERALEESENKFRAIAEISADLIFIFDLDTFTWKYISPAVEQILGYDSDTAVNKPLQDFLPPASWWLFQELLPEKLADFKKGKPNFKVSEFELLNKNGSSVWTELSCHLINEQATGHTLIQGYFHDITERRAAKELLQKMNERMTLANRAAQIGTWDWDLVQDRLEWDDNMYRLYGRSRSDGSDAREAWLAAFHPDQVGISRLKIQSAASGGKEYEDQFTIITPDGAEKRIKAFGDVISDITGRAVRIVGAAYDITQIVKYQEALHESEARFLNAFEFAPIGMILASPNTEFLRVNSALCQMLGYSKAELLQKNLREITHPDDLAKDLGNIKHLLDGSLQIYQTEKRYIHKSGQILWAHVHASLLKNDDGQPRLYVTHIQDITLRKRDEQVQQTYLRQMHVLNELMTDYVFKLTPQDHGWSMSIIAGNFAAASGYPIDAVSEPDAWQNVIHPEDLNKAKGYLAQLIETKQSLKCNFRSLSAAGAIRWLDVILSPELDETGEKIVAIYGSIKNITKQRIAEESLRQSEEKWRTIVKTSPDGIAVIGVDGTLLYASDKLVKWHGYASADEMTGRSVFEFVDSEYHQTIAEKMRGWANWQSDEVTDCKVLRRDGSTFFVELNSGILFDDNGNPESFFAIERDITERRQIREALIESEKKFRTLFETMTQGVIYQDQSGRVVDVNPSALQLFGLRREQLTRQMPLDPCWHAICEDGSPYPPDSFPAEISLQTGKVTHSVAGIFNPESAKYVWVSITAVPEFRQGEDKPARIFSTMADITELKTAHVELSKVNRNLEKAVEQRTREIQHLSNLYQGVLQNAGVAIVATTPNGLITTFNRAAESMLGYSAEEVVGLMTPDLFHNRPALFGTSTSAGDPGNSASRLDQVLQITGAEGGREQEWEMRRKDGTLFPGMLSLSPFMDADGNPGGMIGVARDISREKFMISKLKESEERFSRMFEDHAAVMLLVDPKTGVVEAANKAAKDYYGYHFNNEEKILISDLNMRPADKIKEEMEQATRQNRNYFIFPHRLASGEARTVEVHSSPIESNGKVVLFSIIHDITERLQAEKALRKSEAENRALLNAIPDLFFRLSRDGLFLQIHTGTPSNLYASAKTTLGRHIRDILPANVAALAVESLEKAFANGGIVAFEYNLLIENELRYFENRLVAISDNEALSIVRDITERHNAEAALTRNESLLKMMTVSTPLAFYVADYRTDTILYHNANFSRIWQLEDLEERMRNKQLLHHQVIQECAVRVKDRQNFIDINNQFKFADSHQVVEDELCLVDGRILRRYSSQIRGQQDEYYGRLFIYEDITDRKTQEHFTQLQRDLATRLSATSDLDHALQWSLDVIMEIENVDNAGIYLLNPVNEHFELAAHRNASAEFLADKWHVKPGTEYHRQLMTRKPIYVEFKQLANHHIDFANPEGIVGVASIPMLHEGRIIGSCNLSSKTESRFFKKYEYLFETLAGEIGSAVARIHSERALLISQQNFRMLFETLDDFVFILDLHGHIIMTNPVVPTRLGFSTEQLQQMHVFDLHPVDQRQEAARCLRGMVEGTIAYCPIPLMAENGNLIPVETRVMQGTWDGKQVLYGIARDISERQKTDLALREAEGRWNFALEGSGDGVWDWDLTSNTIYYSKQYKAMIGYPEDEFANTYAAWSSRIHPEDLERCSQDLGRHLRGETDIYINEHRLRHKNGSYRWILDRGKVVKKAEDGRPLRMIGTHSDITDRKLMEQSLRETVEREKELSEMKSRFISVTSHEFRTPLATIMVAAESLLSYHSKMTEQQQKVRLLKIKNQVSDLNKIIEDLLHLSKIQTVESKLEPVEFDLIAMIQDIVDELGAQAEHIRIEWLADSPKLPVVLDKKLIRMAVTNLLANALKYSLPGKRVIIHVTQEEEKVVIRITDEGIGIPEKEIKHLFTPFYRASNVGNIHGTGLGLNIIKDCIAQHGGHIDVNSVVNVGSTFTVHLPQRLEILKQQEQA